jgi:hypothetical protein
LLVEISACTIGMPELPFRRTLALTLLHGNTDIPLAGESIRFAGNASVVRTAFDLRKKTEPSGSVFAFDLCFYLCS